MGKIKQLITDKESILVFDVDGVLAKLEWGEYNHFMGNTKQWNEMCNDNINTYTEEKVSTTMQNFLKNRDKTKVYVITAVYTENEKIFKKEYVVKYYGIPRENVYFVNKNNQKKERLIEIKQKYPNLDDQKLIMIDDTVEILNDIMDNTNFSTVHVSSFLDF